MLPGEPVEVNVLPHVFLIRFHGSSDNQNTNNDGDTIHRQIEAEKRYFLIKDGLHSLGKEVDSSKMSSFQWFFDKRDLNDTVLFQQFQQQKSECLLKAAKLKLVVSFKEKQLKGCMEETLLKSAREG